MPQDPNKKELHAGMTRVRFPPEKADEVIRDIQSRILDAHRKLRNEGLKDAIFLVNREAGEAIGISLWDDKEKLKKAEGKTSREDAPTMKDPGKAPTEFSKLRAKVIQDEGANMESADWYEVVARV